MRRVQSVEYCNGLRYVHVQTMSIWTAYLYLVYNIGVLLSAYSAKAECEHVKLVMTMLEVEVFFLTLEWAAHPTSPCCVHDLR